MKHGEFENVELSNEELTKLQARFEDAQTRIEALSAYMAAKRTKYKSHYAVILMWARRDAAAKPRHVHSERCRDYGFCPEAKAMRAKA